MTSATYPDGAYVPHGLQDGPVITVGFADGGQADFRPGGCRPGSAHVRYDGHEVQGLRVDIWADVDPDGKTWASSVWKSDVAGIDGGADVPEKVRDSAMALCHRRAREAREALRAASR
jgi:hypothetical protein